MNNELSGMKAFVTVAELGSFSKAAEVLNLTQPALTRKIQKIESNLNTALFERTTRKIMLTQAGKMLLPKAKSLIASLDAAIFNISNLTSNVLDLVTPHLHHITGLDPEEHRNNARLSQVMLFVMAIALHKLPEGMAAGVSVCSAEGATEWGVSFGIALQNIPEGMVIIAPLMMAGVIAVRTFFISIFIALLEVIGILLGFGLGSASSTFLPVMLGFAGGAMLYVTSDEMIPETHAHGFQKQATYALLLGFITFVLMEKYV